MRRERFRAIFFKPDPPGFGTTIVINVMLVYINFTENEDRIQNYYYDADSQRKLINKHFSFDMNIHSLKCCFFLLEIYFNAKLMYPRIKAQDFSILMSQTRRIINYNIIFDSLYCEFDV